MQQHVLDDAIHIWIGSNKRKDKIDIFQEFVDSSQLRLF